MVLPEAFYSFARTSIPLCASTVLMQKNSDISSDMVTALQKLKNLIASPLLDSYAYVQLILTQI